MLGGNIFSHDVLSFAIGIAGEGSMGSGCSRILEKSDAHCQLHALQGHCSGGHSVPPWDLHSPSRCEVEVTASVPGDVDGQGIGHAQNTMSTWEPHEAISSGWRNRFL